MAMGRDFLPTEGLPGNDRYVILNNIMWRNRYHSDPQILGKAILIDDQPCTVIGVIEAGHPDKDGESFTVPIVLPPGVHTTYFGAIFGRLKPGVTLSEAQAEITLIRRRLAAERHSTASPADWSITVEPLRNDWLDHKLARNLWLLLAAVAFVLLIACVNVANLLLARGSSRQQEIAVRCALGATRRQVFAQLLAESLTLAVLGGAVGIGIGWVVMKTSITLLPNLVDQVEAPVEFSIPVLCFAAAVTVISGVLFGCAPALKAGQLHLSETLKQGSRSTTAHGRFRLQGTLVAAELALAVTLMAGAGMTLHSFWNLSHIDLGIVPTHVLTVDLDRQASERRNTQTGTATPSREEMIAQRLRMLERIQAVPGVTEAALTTNPPLHGHNSFPFSIEGQPADPSHPLAADLVIVTPGYFRTLGIHLVRGRFLDDSDTLAGPPAVIVNECFVRRYLPGSDPIGRRLMISPPAPHSSGPPLPFLVVGVFHDVLNSDALTGGVQPGMILSFWQNPWGYVGIVVRTADDLVPVTGGIRTAVAQTFPGFTVDQIETMSHRVESQTMSDRFGMALLSALAALALFLAALGVYGVMSFIVAQRTHEIGIRIALGAQRRQVTTLIVGGGLRIALVGMIVGLAGAFAIGRLMHSTLYGVGAADYGSLAAVAAILFVVAVLSCWLPARRSACVDPIAALREE
jgi:putative ABC transport system permease protein